MRQGEIGLSLQSSKLTEEDDSTKIRSTDKMLGKLHLFKKMLTIY